MTRTVSCPAGRGASTHVDVHDLDRVVSVAEAVPGRDLRLRVAAGAGRPGAEGVPADVVRLPVERPVLPPVRAFGRIEPGRVPVAFAGEADVDARMGPVPDQALPRTVCVPGLIAEP